METTRKYRNKINSFIAVAIVLLMLLMPLSAFADDSSDSSSDSGSANSSSESSGSNSTSSSSVGSGNTGNTSTTNESTSTSEDSGSNTSSGSESGKTSEDTSSNSDGNKSSVENSSGDTEKNNNENPKSIKESNSDSDSESKDNKNLNNIESKDNVTEEGNEENIGNKDLENKKSVTEQNEEDVDGKAKLEIASEEPEVKSVIFLQDSELNNESIDEKINVEVVDGNTGSHHLTKYEAKLTHEDGSINESLNYEFMFEVVSHHGNVSQQGLAEIGILFPEKMVLDEIVQLSVSNGSKSWGYSFNTDEKVLTIVANHDNSKLTVGEWVKLLFTATTEAMSNIFTIGASRVPGESFSNSDAHNYTLVGEVEVIVDPGNGDPGNDDPIDDDPVNDDPIDEDPNEDPDDPDPDLPEIIGPFTPIITPLATPPTLPTVEVPVAPVAVTAVPDAETAEEVVLEAPQEPQVEIVEPDAPQVLPVVEEQSINFWPLLLLLIPGLLWFLWVRLVLVRVLDSEGEYRTVARKLARRRDKRWYVEIGQQLDKYLAEHGEVMVDFRSGLIKEAKKAIYTGETVLSTGDVRFAVINRQRFTSWVEKLHERTSKIA